MSANASTTEIHALAANAGQAADLLKSMAHPVRLLLLCLLADREYSVSELNLEVRISQSALSQHLARLRREQLVTTRRAAQSIHYRLANPAVTRIIQTLQEAYCPDRDTPESAGDMP